MSQIPENFVVKCAICNEPITEEYLTFHRYELCKIPIREEFKQYLIKQGYTEEEIHKHYQKGMIQFKDLGHSREITVEVYTRDMLVLGYCSMY